MSITISLRKIRKSFTFRIFAAFTISTASITLFFTVLLMSREVRSYKLQSAEKTHLLASLLADNIRLPLYAENNETLARMATETAQNPTVIGITIFNNREEVVARLSKGKYLSPENVLSKTVLVTPAAETPSEDNFLSGRPSSIDKIIGSVRLDLDLSDMNKKVHALIVSSILWAVTFWLLVLSFSYLIFRRVTRSFHPLLAGIEAIRQGDFNSRITTDGDDELGNASRAVNDLASALKSREDENRRLNEELVRAMHTKIDEEKNEVMAKLIETNRMTSLGLLVSSMAHEINNPTGSIRLAGNYSSKAWKDAVPILERVALEEGDFSLGGIPFSVAREEILVSGEAIIRNTERIERVIQDLRAYSLGGKNEFQDDIDINHVVVGALAIVRAHGSHGDVTLSVNQSSTVPKINGNYHQLEQVVINLILNAIQSMSDGQGTVVVRTDYGKDNDMVAVTVSDNGEGIPPENIQRLFEPFFSTRLEKGGSGLGLYISNFIISEHKGMLHIASPPGAGTEVTILLPKTERFSGEAPGHNLSLP